MDYLTLAGIGDMSDEKLDREYHYLTFRTDNGTQIALNQDGMDMIAHNFRLVLIVVND